MDHDSDERRAAAAALVTELFGSTRAMADPYPLLRRLRELDPVHVAENGRVFLTRYEDCSAVTRNTALVAQSPDWMDHQSPDWRDHPAVVQNIESVLFRDPPEHTRLRRLVNRSFTPRRVERLREAVEGLVGRTLDRFADAGSDGGAVEAYDLLAASLPIAVVGTMIGIPEADWKLLHDPTSAVMQVVEVGVGENKLASADQGAMMLNEYFTELVAERRRNPQGDIISDLVVTRDENPDPDSGGMTETELLQMVILLFGAGVDTTVGLLSNGVMAFIENPEQARLLRENPGLAQRAVDEVLRYDTPTHVIVRVAAEGAIVADTPVEPMRTVYALSGAAHRDPAKFENPDVFDITREGTSVLSFSGGIHYCVGAPLARLEAETFFPTVVSRFPGLRLAGEPVKRGFVVRGYTSLPLAIR